MSFDFPRVSGFTHWRRKAQGGGDGRGVSF